MLNTEHSQPIEEAIINKGETASRPFERIRQLGEQAASYLTIIAAGAVAFAAYRQISLEANKDETDKKVKEIIDDTPKKHTAAEAGEKIKEARAKTKPDAPGGHLNTEKPQGEQS